MRALAPAWPPKARASMHEHRQPFGGRVHRGRESRRAGADDGDVVDALGALRVEHADALRRARFSVGIAQHRAVGADRERQILGARRVALDERARVGVVRGIEHLVRNAVAGQEIAQPRDVRRAGRADQHRAARAGLDQRHAAQDQRAHDLLAERRPRRSAARAAARDRSAAPRRRPPRCRRRTSGVPRAGRARPRSCPATCSTTGMSWPWASRPVMRIVPESTTKHAGDRLAGLDQLLAVLVALRAWRSGACDRLSAALRIGKACA